MKMTPNKFVQDQLPQEWAWTGGGTEIRVWSLNCNNLGKPQKITDLIKINEPIAGSERNGSK